MKTVKALSGIAFVLLLALQVQAQEYDLNSRDSLKLQLAKTSEKEYRVSVEVHNDEELAGLDIPLRFGENGDAVSLVRVEWADRVLDWDFKHAEIDSVNKTVILGLIAELGGTRPDPYLAPLTAQDPTIATLVFSVKGSSRPDLSTFTTAEPYHALTFLYNTMVDSVLTVREFEPLFEATAAGEK
jgi:hypothetical protein